MTDISRRWTAAVTLLAMLGCASGERSAPGAVPSTTAGPLPSLPAPTKSIGVMFNFPPLEAGAPAREPAFFVRTPNALAAADESIELPTYYDTVLYEAELVIVVGKRASRVTPEEADAFIFGYTCGMDGSPAVFDADGERDTARSLAGKSADGVAPVGPDVARTLNASGHAIVLRVNGEEVDRANTRDMIWSPRRIVSEISQAITLEPGDLIFCGANRPVPKMRVGDVVEVEVENISRLSCSVVAPQARGAN